MANKGDSIGEWRGMDKIHKTSTAEVLQRSIRTVAKSSNTTGAK
jgi:hypothetical protein